MLCVADAESALAEERRLRSMLYIRLFRDRVVSHVAKLTNVWLSH